MKIPGTRFFLGAAFLGAMGFLPATSHAQFSIGISINVGPPALPVYVQPPCPQPNYMWTPGYWAWDGVGDYYWVPGTWVMAPQPGYLWTPGYWGWGDGGAYVFHDGYWGSQVGFYGGVNYGFGYGGGGFAGGEWRGGNFAYNTAAVNVNTTVIHTTYINNTVINNTTINNTTHTSFNGGPNGVAAKPTAQQLTFASQKHFPPTQAQQQHIQVAKQDKSNFASANHGVPAHAAVPRPATNVAELQHSAVAAKAAPGVKPYVARPVATRPAAQTAQTKPGAKPVANSPAAANAKPAANSSASPAKPEPAVKAAQSARSPEVTPKATAKPAPTAVRGEPKPAVRPAPAAKAAPKTKEPPPERKPEPKPQQ